MRQPGVAGAEDQKGFAEPRQREYRRDQRRPARKRRQGACSSLDVQRKAQFCAGPSGRARAPSRATTSSATARKAGITATQNTGLEIIRRKSTSRRSRAPARQRRRRCRATGARPKAAPRNSGGAMSATSASRGAPANALADAVDKSRRDQHIDSLRQRKGGLVSAARP